MLCIWAYKEQEMQPQVVMNICFWVSGQLGHANRYWIALFRAVYSLSLGVFAVQDLYDFTCTFESYSFSASNSSCILFCNFALSVCSCDSPYPVSALPAKLALMYSLSISPTALPISDLVASCIQGGISDSVHVCFLLSLSIHLKTFVTSFRCNVWSITFY